MATIEQIIYHAKALLRNLEDINEDGTVWYQDQEAALLDHYIDEWEKQNKQ